MGNWEADSWRPRWWIWAAISGLCVLAYLRALQLPFIADDYVQIQLAREYGPVSGWKALAADALYRCRATSLVLTWWIERWFGLEPVYFNWASLAVHILNTWLVVLLGYWRVIGWRVSVVGAAYFAVCQQHQEAVIWDSALPELLVFLFTIAGFLCWLRWLRAPARRGLYYAGCLLCFLLALLSKESAVVLVPLLALAAVTEDPAWRRRLPAILPFAAAAAAYAGLIFAARKTHLHFNDAGTFTLGWHFAPVLARSAARLLSVWGSLGVIALLGWRAREWRRLLLVAAAWIAITLLPYSFLSYMPFVPSRHTYFASAGLSWIIAAFLLTVRQRAPARPRLAWVLAGIILVQHCGYLWGRKHRQFLERAWPTEALVSCVRDLEGPVYLECFPYDFSVAEFAVRLRGNNHVRLLRAGAGPAPERSYSLRLCDDSSAPCQGAEASPPPSIFAW